MSSPWLLQPGGLYAYAQVLGSNWNLVCRDCGTRLICVKNVNQQHDYGFGCPNCPFGLLVTEWQIKREIEAANNNQPTHWPVHSLLAEEKK